METNNRGNYILFIAIAIAILFTWQYFNPTPPPIENQTTTKINQQDTADLNNTNNTVNQTKIDYHFKPNELIQVNTDNYLVKIDKKTGNIVYLDLLKSNSAKDEGKIFNLFSTNEKIYLAETGLLDEKNEYFLKDIPYQSKASEYQLSGNSLLVELTKKSDSGIEIKKIFKFTKNSYTIEIANEINNQSEQTLNLTAMYRLLKDSKEPDGTQFFAYSYHGPVLYTPEEKYQKISFEDIDKNNASYQNSSKSGWLGFSQHYFASLWILQTKGEESICEVSACSFDISKRNTDGLYSVGFVTKIPTVLPHQIQMNSVKLFAGPQEFKSLATLADNLDRVKDYGKVYIIASPLFWLLSKLHDLVHNWGWAIVLLVILIKIVLYPLTAASYRSMAKMRTVAPKLQELKALYGDDKLKMQQEMMQLYKKEKINPLGGCLPMLLQIPVFIGLYWALFNSVELRQAPWIGWITDLSRIDPYYILPIIMAATMFLQTHLNPPPTDPMQAKLMKIMPIVFSIFFFFFPAGLVLYWIVNNILSITQQWYINKSIEKMSKSKG